MNESQIRQRVHEVFGEAPFPGDFKSRLERSLEQPAPRLEYPRAMGIVAVTIAFLIMGGLILARSQINNLGGSGELSEHTYSVAAILEIQPDGSTDICYPVINLNYPGDRCPFSVPLQIDKSSLPQAKTLRDGTIWTPLLEVTGKWTGKALVATASPQPAKAGTPAGGAVLDTGNAPDVPTDAFHRNQARLMADDAALRDKGIWVAGSGWSRAGFHVILVAADQTQIDYVKRQYHADIVVSWFKLIS